MKIVALKMAGWEAGEASEETNPMTTPGTNTETSDPMAHGTRTCADSENVRQIKMAGASHTTSNNKNPSKKPKVPFSEFRP